VTEDIALFSAFGRILREVVEGTPGALGAVFTDWEGEPVDQYALGETLDIQIFGAQWGLVLKESRASLARARAGAPQLIQIECDQVRVLMRMVSDSYFVVLQTRLDAHLGKTLAALEAAAVALAKEM
jgi:predicted regulator of Ras-like GTPase activity (Roadblock/LC7/MglB family)